MEATEDTCRQCEVIVNCNRTLCGPLLESELKNSALLAKVYPDGTDVSPGGQSSLPPINTTGVCCVLESEAKGRGIYLFSGFPLALLTWVRAIEYSYRLNSSLVIIGLRSFYPLFCRLSSSSVAVRGG